MMSAPYCIRGIGRAELEDVKVPLVGKGGEQTQGS
jgi:hypothetical protein